MSKIKEFDLVRVKHPINGNWTSCYEGDIVRVTQINDNDVIVIKNSCLFRTLMSNIEPIKLKKLEVGQIIQHKINGEKYKIQFINSDCVYAVRLNSTYTIKKTITLIYADFNILNKYKITYGDVKKLVARPHLLFRVQTNAQYKMMRELYYFYRGYKPSYDKKPYKSKKKSYYEFSEYMTHKSYNKNIENMSTIINISDYEEHFKKLLICPICGKHKITHLVDGEKMCNECANKKTKICPICGKSHLLKYMRKRKSDDCYICADCQYSNSYYECEHCGKLEKSNRMKRTIYGIVCESCVDVGEYKQCISCGKYEKTKHMYSGYCSNCYNKKHPAITGYHPSIKLNYYGKGKKPVFKGFGVELEIDSHKKQYDTHKIARKVAEITKNHTYHSRDGSLHNGFEIITHPHTYNQLMKIEWKKLFNMLLKEGFSKVGANRAGFHVHISREYFGDDDSIRAEALSKMLYFYDVFYDNMVKISRRTQNSLRWCGKPNTPTKESAIDYNKYGGCRGAVNLNNTRTVEIRMMRGTLDYDEFKAKLDIIKTVAKNSIKLDWDNINDFGKWLSGCKPETFKYINKRGVKYES